MEPHRIPVLLMVRELGIGGCERDLTKLAIELKESDFEPHVACFKAEGLRAPELRAAGIPVLHLPVTSFKSPSAIRGAIKLRTYIREHKISILQAFDVPADMFAVPVARMIGVPVVIGSQLGHRALYPRSQQRILRFVDRMAHWTVVNSRAVADDLIQNAGTPPDRIFLSYNGVNTNIFSPPRQPRSAPVGTLVVGTACALRPEKRLDVLLRAFARVGSEFPNLRLQILGSGPQEAELKQLASELNINSICEFHPAVEDVADWLRRFDVFVLCSESESFPNSVLEAMACGCAVIASRVGGVPELVQDGKNGMLFGSGDIAELQAKLRELVVNPALRQQLAAKGALTAREQFSMKVAANRMSQFYHRALDEQTHVNARGAARK